MVISSYPFAKISIVSIEKLSKVVQFTLMKFIGHIWRKEDLNLPEQNRF